VRQKFDAYERDNETGLDFAEARYYASLQGRFTSVDPLNPVLEYRSQADSVKEKNDNERNFREYLSQPQSWNAYVYVLNQPLTFIDPDGLGWKRVDGKDKDGKDTFYYMWVDDMKVHDAPYGNYQYVNTQGQVVFLNSTEDGKWHAWSIQVATTEDNWDSQMTNVHDNDKSRTPTGHKLYGDVKQDLLNAGYERHGDPHPDHIGAVNFWTDKSPTLNISVYAGKGWFKEPDAKNPVTGIEAHNEKYNPTKQMRKHIQKEVIPNIWSRIPKPW
jgi:RHS repeat-associated protein